MRESVFDLAYYYYNNFHKDKPEMKKSIIVDLATLLSEGWTTKELRKFMSQNIGNNFDIVKYTVDKNPTEVNLISPLKFYYHAELRITSGPPKMDLDYDSGNIVKIIEPFFLEPVGSYTMEDLVFYFLSKDKLYSKQTYNKKRLIGSLNYLLAKYSVQDLLYAMDIAQTYIEGHDMDVLRQPLEIEQYIPKAKEALDSKKTESKLNGDDRIVYRKRV